MAQGSNHPTAAIRHQQDVPCLHGHLLAADRIQLANQAFRQHSLNDDGLVLFAK